MITMSFKCSVKVFEEILELVPIYFNPILSSAKYRSFFNRYAAICKQKIFSLHVKLKVKRRATNSPHSSNMILEKPKPVY